MALIGGTVVGLLSLLGSSAAEAATLYVAKTGSDSGNNCSNQASPCSSIAKGIGAMAAGDTLVIGDGTYTDSIVGMPSGSASAYTTIRAANDWGVLIDGSGYSNSYKSGINISSKHYVQVRGLRVKMNQTTTNNEPIVVISSDHIKIQRCAGSYGPTTDNAATIDIGPMSSYVLIEECYAFGGGRYQFLVYQSDHVVVRRSVARLDHWTGTLQCAGFTNYDSLDTAWQNNIVLDSDTANCSGNLYGGFFNENKTDYAPDTSESLQGNIVLNVKAFYAGDLDWVISGTRQIEDMVIWGSSGGYWGDQGDGVTANISATRLTIGGLTGTYDGPNAGAGLGTGVSIYGPLQNSVKNSIFSGCHSLGVADYTASDYNAFWNNGANYGGTHRATPGANDRTDDVVTSSLLYLPRIEAGSPLKTAGESGGQIGAQVLVKIGGSGTLYGDPGWDQPTSDPLWPFPNEDQIRRDMASYTGPGGVGARGFATGNSLDGTPQTLTKYVWEYLGNQIPMEVYGLHIAIDSLPPGTVGKAYSATVSVGGGSAPYTWSVTAGSLPAGLTLDPATGAITGTPTVAGTADVTITATDAGSRTTSKPLSIVVAAGPTGGGGGGGGVGGVSGGCACCASGTRGSARAGLLAALFAVVVVRRRRR